LCLFSLQYDMKLYEDENVNRMHEAIQLFDEICNSKWFKSTSMILFLNKSDLFKDKIQNVDMNVCFSDYTGGKSYKNGCAYLKASYSSRFFFFVFSFPFYYSASSRS
jgi:guanine nucleotide-binding protein G(i) subunit alpha